jgi:hypothetical protein
MTTTGEAAWERIHHRVTLLGQCILPDGSASGNADVELRWGGGVRKAGAVLKMRDDAPSPPRSTATNADGSFHFADLPAGRFDVMARTSLVIDERWTRFTAEATVSIPKENVTSAVKPARLVFLKIELQKIDSI